MAQCFLLAFLIGDQHGLARIAFEQHGAAFAFDKIAGTDLATIDQRKHQAVSKGAEFFHQVERQRCPAGAQHMQEADLRIETRGLDG